jgi:hypothetical protein
LAPLAVLGGLLFVAKRNAGHDDEDDSAAEGDA